MINFLKKYFIYCFLFICFFESFDVKAVKTNELITETDLLNAGALKKLGLQNLLDYAGVSDVSQVDPKLMTRYINESCALKDLSDFSKDISTVVVEIYVRLHLGKLLERLGLMQKERTKYPYYHNRDYSRTNEDICHVSRTEISLWDPRNGTLMVFSPKEDCKVQSKRVGAETQEIKEIKISQTVYEALGSFMLSFKRENTATFYNNSKDESYFLLQRSDCAQTIYVDINHGVLEVFPTIKSTLSGQLRPLPNGYYIYFDIKHNCEDERLNGRYLRAQMVNPFEDTRLEIFPLATQNVDLEDFPIVMFQGILNPISDASNTPLMIRPLFFNGDTFKEVDPEEYSPYMQDLSDIFHQIDFREFNMTHGISRWIETNIGPVMAHFFFAPAETLETLSEYPTVIDLHGGPEVFETAFEQQEDKVEKCHRITLCYPGTIGFEGNFKSMIYQNPHYVKPCLTAVKGLRNYLETLPFINLAKLVLRGSSFGGFIVGHAAQDPDLSERFSHFISVIPKLMTTDCKREDGYDAFHHSRGLYDEEAYSTYSLDRGLDKVKRPWTIIAGEKDQVVPINKHVHPLQRALKKLSEEGNQLLSSLIKVRIVPNLGHKLPKRGTVKEGFYKEDD